MATLQSDLSLTYLNVRSLTLAILLAIFLQIVLTGPAFSDGGHGGDPVSRSNGHLPVLCLPHDFLVQQIRGHGEELVALGTAVGKQGLLFVDREDGSWSWLIRLDPETSCIVAAGDDWRDAPQSLVGEPS